MFAFLAAPPSCPEQATYRGQPLKLRPVVPGDDLLLAELLASLAPPTRRARFHGAFKLSFPRVQQMCQVDQQRHVALVVTGTWDGVEQLVADARYVVCPDGTCAELALLVHEQWQRQGVGEWMLRSLEQTARRAGLRELVAQVLPDNAPMLALMARCNYSLQPDPQEPGLLQARRALHPVTWAQRLTSLMNGRFERFGPGYALT